MNRSLSRRRFLARAAMGSAGAAILLPAASAWGYQANERIRCALIGCGGRGVWCVETMPKMTQVTALCDVNQRKIEEAFQRWDGLARQFADSPHSWETSAAAEYRTLLADRPPTFRDFREMFDGAGETIDAVVVSTPDHTHAVASAAAMRAGKHVFCEKPLTRTVHESRALREIARETKVATSMGNQGTASHQFRRALELVRDGTLGAIEQVHVWNTGGGSDRKTPPEGDVPVPDYIDWDLWIGPAAMRPFHPQWMQRNSWRDFGTCQLGNWGPHSANLAFMAMKVHELWLADPAPPKPPIVRIKAEHSGVNRLSFPRWEIVRWELPARAEFPPITFNWYNGPAPESRDLLAGLLRARGATAADEQNLLSHAGALIVGSRGTIAATGHNATFILLPEKEYPGVEKNRPQEVDSSRGHEMDWLLACRGGKAPWANFDYASALVEFLMLGNVATQFEETLEFDPVAMKIVNHAEADACLRSEYREGWPL